MESIVNLIYHVCFDDCAANKYGGLFLFASVYPSILLENSTSQTIQTLKQVSYSLSQENSRYIHTIASIATDKSVLDLTASLHHEKDTQSHFMYAVQLDEQMKGYFHDMPDLISATFIFKTEALTIMKARNIMSI